MAAHRIRKLAAALVLAWAAVAPAWAGPADVVDARATKTGQGPGWIEYRFDVTVVHEDQGLDHYADAWEILGPDGAVIATRELLHPHVDEQPFTRSLAGVKIPRAVRSVTVRAHDTRHGYRGRTFRVTLPR